MAKAKGKKTPPYISFRIEPELREQFEVKAKATDRDISQMLRKLVREFVNGNPGTSAK